ncbi:MAG: hypothetical protein U5R49_16300 [Deltaproteobacteria bacterium]|nr:hypothetical protein [Deltaproteobacteria bacterium]
MNQKEIVSEYSRIICHPDFRGYGLSKKMILFALTISLKMGNRIVFGGCHPAQVPMYKKYGWRITPGTAMDLERDLQCVGYSMVADISKDLESPYEKDVNGKLAKKLTQDGYVCMCPNLDCWCDVDSFKAEKTDDCPLKGHAV